MGGIQSLLDEDISSSQEKDASSSSSFSSLLDPPSPPTFLLSCLTGVELPVMKLHYSFVVGVTFCKPMISKNDFMYIFKPMGETANTLYESLSRFGQQGSGDDVSVLELDIDREGEGERKEKI